MKCVELLGMSRAGKTTQIQEVAKAMQNAGFSMAVVGRPHVEFKTFSSATEFHHHYLRYLAKAIEHNSGKDFVVLDRGFYDRMVLARFDYENGALSSEGYRGVEASIQEHTPRVDVGLLLMLSPEESLRRFVEQKRKGLDFSYLNEGMIDCDQLAALRALHTRYQSLANNPKLNLLDATQDISTVSQAIVRLMTSHGKR